MCRHHLGQSLAMLTLCVAGGVVSTAVVHAADITLHVAHGGSDQATGEASAPFATPQRALRAVEEIAQRKADADVRVVLHGGAYRIESPLVFTRDTVPPQGGMTLTSSAGETAVISGGREISGWNVRPDGTWSRIIPEAASGQWRFRELFVNGQRRPRARHPNTGFVRIVESFPDKRSGFTFRKGDLPTDWTAGGELVFLHDWSTSRIPIRSVTHETRRLTAAFPIGNRADHYKIDHFEPHPRYYVENHWRFLDSPGEWWLDEKSGELRYLPLPDESPDAVEVIAPQATALLNVTGDESGPIRNVHIERIQFEHCAWQLPAGGFASSQASAYEWRNGPGQPSSRRFIPAAIRFERAEACSFTKGRIAHLGTSGIEFGSRTERCRLEDCVIEDLSGNGVNLGEDRSRMVGSRPWWQSNPDQVAAGHVVAHNTIRRCGQQFFGAVAVWVGIAREMQITNNEIAHHPYTGVSLGWMWDPTPTPAGGNIVSENHIHHVMQVLSDGGGIYTLGRQPGTRLAKNLIHDVPLNAGRAESNGMFLDEGSDQFEITGNVIFHIDRSPLRFHRAEHLSVRLNTLVVADEEMPPLRYNNTDPETIKQIENRVVTQDQFDAQAVSVPETGPRRMDIGTLR